jgi:hypothetical protein
MHSSTHMDHFSFTTAFLIDIDQLDFVFLIAVARDALHDQWCSEIADDENIR